MSDRGILLIDGNALLHASASHTRLMAGTLETTAVHGVLGHVRSLMSLYGRLFAPIVLWDGTTWRKTVFADYKLSRDVLPEDPKPYQIEAQRMRQAAKAQKRYVVRMLRHLGVHQMRSENLEADDLAGMLVTRYSGQGRRVMMATGDRDWMQLVRPGVGWMCPIHGARIQRLTVNKFPELLGVRDGRQWLELKALVGDKSDEIPGVGGIGEVTGKALLAEHGSVDAFWWKVSTREIDIAGLPKKLRQFCESERGHNAFMRNMHLMDLSHPGIPKPLGLDLDKGSLDPKAFVDFCHEFAFVGVLRAGDAFLEPFRTETA